MLSRQEAEDEQENDRSGCPRRARCRLWRHTIDADNHLRSSRRHHIHCTFHNHDRCRGVGLGPAASSDRTGPKVSAVGEPCVGPAGAVTDPMVVATERCEIALARDAAVCPWVVEITRSAGHPASGEHARRASPQPRGGATTGHTFPTGGQLEGSHVAATCSARARSSSNVTLNALGSPGTTATTRSVNRSIVSAVSTPSNPRTFASR